MVEQEWKHIEAHADVDEKLAAGGGPLRYPEHGHVLYLEVGPKVQGPTCVWEGGAFDGAMTTVPAVPGRVLRFQGKLQHAVPRPADVWLSPFVISQSGSAEDFVRSVVLFNCWEEPPLDVTADEVPLLDGNGDALMQITSNPRKLWKTAEPQPAAALSGKEATMKLWLLGDKERRGQTERTRPIAVDPEAVMTALEETEACTRLGAVSS